MARDNKTRQVETNAGKMPSPTKGNDKPHFNASVTVGHGLAHIHLGNVSLVELTLLMVYFMSVKILFNFPTALSQEVGSSAWISVITASVFGFFGMWGWIRWCNVTGDEGFVPSLRATLGPLLGDLTAATVAVGFLVGSALNIRLFSGGTIIGLLPQFPLDILLALSTATAVYASWLGLEPVARIAVIVFVPTLTAITVVLLGVADSFDVRNLLPLWGLGLKTTLAQGALHSGIYGTMPALAVMKSYVRKEENVARAGFNSMGISSAIMTLTLIAVAGVFPFPISAARVEPFGVMARSVALGRFVQRFEAVFTFTWFIATIVQSSFAFLVILVILAQLCNTRTYRPFIPAISVLAFGIAGIPSTSFRAGQVLESFFQKSLGNAFVALGWVLYIIASLKGLPSRGRGTGNHGQSTREGGKRESS